MYTMERFTMLRDAVHEMRSRGVSGHISENKRTTIITLNGGQIEHVSQSYQIRINVILVNSTS